MDFFDNFQVEHHTLNMFSFSCDTVLVIPFEAKGWVVTSAPTISTIRQFMSVVNQCEDVVHVWECKMWTSGQGNFALRNLIAEQKKSHSWTEEIS